MMDTSDLALKLNSYDRSRGIQYLSGMTDPDQKVNFRPWSPSPVDWGRPFSKKNGGHNTLSRTLNYCWVRHYHSTGGGQFFCAAGSHQSFVCHIEELSSRHIVQCAPRRRISSCGDHLTDEQAVGSPLPKVLLQHVPWVFDLGKV